MKVEGGALVVGAPFALVGGDAGFFTADCAEKLVENGVEELGKADTG